MTLVIAIFVTFGLGPEGKKSAGHDLLWLLLEPEMSLAGLGIIPPALQLFLLPVNSAIWGLACALVVDSLRYFTRK